ncbi:MAG TPA: type II toxin-antitoxin system RelE/ParE family toxin [Pirellulales bacterium]|jgi:plasmid stabilization system protein ParE|nr:type II toxin-antitoxin system RelE/ParE family toxin [Pirellulales bacterium]
MTRAIRFRHEAQLELAEAACWYEARRAGLGQEFVAGVQKTLELIASRPELFGIVLKDIRQARVSRSPYSVYYRLLPQEIVVLSIFHGNRDPSQWQQRT